MKRFFKIILLILLILTILIPSVQAIRPADDAQYDTHGYKRMIGV